MEKVLEAERKKKDEEQLQIHSRNVYKTEDRRGVYDPRREKRGIRLKRRIGLKKMGKDRNEYGKWARLHKR